MSEGREDQLEDRVLVLAPTGRDAVTSRSLFEGSGVRCDICGTIEDICREAGRGAGVAVVTAEAVLGDKLGRLAVWLGAQPPWSDFPLVVLTPGGADSPSVMRALDAVGHMTLMKRPVQISTLMSTVRNGLRDRKRQYAMRDVLAERERAAEALRAEREQFRVTLSSIGDAVIATDTGGRVTFLNQVAEQLTGWESDAARGLPLDRIFRIVNETTRRPVPNPALKALEEGVVVGLANHTILISRDGSERPLDDSAAPIRGVDGGVIGAVLVFRDISDKKAAEAAVRESEGRYRALVNATSDVVYRMSADWSEMRHLDGRELIADTNEPSHSWIDTYIPEDEHGRVTAAIDAAVREKRVFELEHRVLRVDGSIGWTFTRAIPILDQAGDIVEWFGAASDVTARKQAEEGLAASRARLDYAVRASGIGFWYCDLPFDVLRWDARVKEHFWLPPDAGVTIGTFYERIHPDDREPTRAAIDRAIGERGGYDVQYRTVDAVSGAVKWVRALGGAAYGPDGRPVRFDGVTIDVTRQRRAEEELRDADRKKDDFIALLAHELRNPLAPIRNGVQVLRLAGGDVEAVGRARAMMERQLTHMVRLIDDLLDVSRISRNKMELRRERVLLGDVVASAVETARPMIDAAGHELTLSLPHGPVFLDADLTRLAQVVSNLLTNSAKYTTPGGKIRLSAARHGKEVEVTVSDNGIGIPAAALRNIFDMFSQVDRSVERSTGGLGIGLALVKGLVEMHGGTVTAESPGEGGGSTFTVRLPATDGRAATSTPGVGGDGPRASGMRILVVDDNRDGADSLSMMLDMMGNEVRTAHDGLQAVERAGEFRPEVILMDVGMPRLNGLDATRRIREQDWGKGITIIALTGWGQDNDRERSREAGCNGHLVKPVGLPDLEKMLGEVRK